MTDTLKPEAVLVETSGKVPAAAVDEARERIAALARFTPKPILYARVSLGQAPKRGARKPWEARAVLSVNGRLIRAEAGGATAHVAIAEIQDRLRAGLTRLVRRPSGPGHRP